MKLMRVGDRGGERPAVRTGDGRVLGLAALTPDIDGAFLAGGGLDRVRAALEEGGLPEMEVEGVRVGAPSPVRARSSASASTTATTRPRRERRSRSARWSS
ncbi:hypothetical protein ACFQHO_50335 [Actinomadura yumaensis]|uniref:hypothetical protein n=1 Tax=Actinomadura yumaensis TaxID=111807 RepID=UPI0036224FB5